MWCGGCGTAALLLVLPVVLYGQLPRREREKRLGRQDTCHPIKAPIPLCPPPLLCARRQVLAELELTEDEFIDLCILCGCDYTSKIPSIGPVRALALIKKHGSIEKILAELDPEKYKVRFVDGGGWVKGGWVAEGVRLHTCCWRGRAGEGMR